MNKTIDTVLYTVQRFWKAIAGFFSIPAALIAYTLIDTGEWPNEHDWKVALGYALAALFLVAVAPPNRAKR